MFITACYCFILDADKMLTVSLGCFTICRRCISNAAKDAKTRALLDRIIRVDHAGELGANRIYAGQLAVLGRTSVGPTIKVKKLLRKWNVDIQ